MQFKNFKAPGGVPVKVFAENIMHSAFINPEWTNLRDDFWSAAYAAGCISQDMVQAGNSIEQAQAKAKNDQITYNVQLREAMQVLIDEGHPDKLDSSGKPKIPVLAQVMGRAPTAQQRNQVWNQMQRDKE